MTIEDLDIEGTVPQFLIKILPNASRPEKYPP